MNRSTNHKINCNANKICTIIQGSNYSGNILRLLLIITVIKVAQIRFFDQMWPISDFLMTVWTAQIGTKFDFFKSGPGHFYMWS